MKKLGVLIALVFVVFLNLLAIESAPSETVGYVRYDCQNNANGDYNFIAISMDAGYSNASDLGADYPFITSVKQWDPTAQEWVASDNWGGGVFVPDNALDPNEAIWITIDTASESIYIAGSLNDPAQYNLVSNANGDYNVIMLPFEESGLTDSQSLGNDISNCSSVKKWDPVEQEWVASDNWGGTWVPVFDTDTAQPYRVIVSSNSTWPSSRYESIETQPEVVGK